MSSVLESLKYKRGELFVIDQLKLPNELDYIQILNSENAWEVIRSMQVRGAPLIAIVAALGLAVDAYNSKHLFATTEEARSFLLQNIEHLRTSRPTAVNLFVATDELTEIINRHSSLPDASSQSLISSYIDAAESMLEKDVLTNKSIGKFGAEKILEITGKDKIRVLTICNTGSLATAGYGTALGVIRHLHGLGKLEHVYACETRPYNQGARLTAFEIVQDNLPGTLICDSMASYLMAVKGVDCVVVGADRVAANGDTANKIGTYQLAIAAKYHKVPFFAAVPVTTFDVTIPNGSFIHVELRPAKELTSIFGINIAPEEIAAWNPSFDVTPCSLIRGIITDVGVVEASKDSGSDGIIDIPTFLGSKGLSLKCQNAAVPTCSPTGYMKLDETNIGNYLVSTSKLVDILGTKNVGDLSIAEVGDGNLNFVYIINGPKGSLIAKQALPYVRCVGESWPLTLERATFESNALRIQRKLCPEFVPEVYLFDASKALIVMEYVPPPHLILRKALISGTKLPKLADHVSTFLAKTLYGTSALNLDGGTLRTNVAEWSKNSALCALSEQVIFTDPYHTVAINHWTAPQLDSYVKGIQSDIPLKVAVAELKSKFLNSTEALLHGDLHSGSIMVTESTSFVIDPEFAFYGPIGFDIGAIIANLFLSYFSQSAHSGGDNYAEWVLNETVSLYNQFEEKFIKLWNDGNGGEAFKSGPFPPKSPELLLAQSNYMKRILKDSLGFAGAKMIRRIVGIAHVADLESISDADIRSSCEKRCLLLAKELILKSFDSFKDAASRAHSIYQTSILPSSWP